MKTILLIRHADPAMTSPEVTDFFIPISEKGRIKQKKVCDELKKHIITINTIYTSQLLRAQETAEIVQEAFLCPLIPFEPLGMPFSQEKVLTLIKSLHEESTTCFVRMSTGIGFVEIFL